MERRSREAEFKVQRGPHLEVGVGVVFATLFIVMLAGCSGVSRLGGDDEVSADEVPPPNVGKRVLHEYEGGIQVEEEFYPDGAIARTVVFRDGEPFGSWYEWHPDGTLAGVGNWSSNGPTGLWIRWDANGRETSSSVFDNGVELKLKDE